jgi:hypothetical protein
MTINQITSKLNQFFETINRKVTKMVPMPAILLLCAAMNRPGLSRTRSLANICRSLEELGIPTKNNPDGSPNLIVSVASATLEEVYRAMCEDAVVQGGAQAGTVSIMSQGANSAGPVVSTGTNTLPFNIFALIQ